MIESRPIHRSLLAASVCLLTSLNAFAGETHVGVSLSAFSGLSSTEVSDRLGAGGDRLAACTNVRLEEIPDPAHLGLGSGFDTPQADSCNNTFSMSGRLALAVRREVSSRASLTGSIGVQGGSVPGGIEWTAGAFEWEIENGTPRTLVQTPPNPDGTLRPRVQSRGHTAGILMVKASFDGQYDLSESGGTPFLAAGVHFGAGARWESLGPRTGSLAYWWLEDAKNQRTQSERDKKAEAMAFMPLMGASAGFGYRTGGERAFSVRLDYSVSAIGGRSDLSGYATSVPEGGVKLLPLGYSGIELTVGFEFN